MLQQLAAGGRCPPAWRSASLAHVGAILEALCLRSGQKTDPTGGAAESGAENFMMGMKKPPPAQIAPAGVFIT